MLTEPASTTFERPTSARISLSSLGFNLRAIRDFIGPETAIMGVVKADAYGHGAVECSRRLELEGVDWLAVALPEEGVQLRNAGIQKPILCLGGFWHGQEDLLLDHRITPVVYRREHLSALSEAALKRGMSAAVHVKIDTGMGRIGVRFDGVSEFIDALRSVSGLEVEGIMSHFATADDLSNNAFTHQQMRQFSETVKLFMSNGFRPKYTDIANSPGAIAHPESRTNIVRLGGVLYGLGDDVLPTGVDKPTLKPVMSLTTQIAYVKHVPPGTGLGYGRSFITERDSLIATIPIGYADGLPRSLSNCGRVLINGRVAPVAGRLSMDWTTVDVTGLDDVEIGDEVVVLGEQHGQRLTAGDLALSAGTISYEITCGIGPRVPKVFVE